MERPLVITGVSSGIGADCARYCAERGHTVIGTVRKPSDAEALHEALGDRFHSAVMDVRDADGVHSATAEIENILQGKGLYGLVNNAGVAVSGPIQHVDVDEVAYQLDVNVLGVIRVTQALLPLLGADRSLGHAPGRIVNVSSISGLMTRPFAGPYSASKHALEAISNALRYELGSVYGIKVSMVNPGPIDTPIWEKARQADNPYLDTDYAPILKNRDRAITRIEDSAIPVEQVSKQIYKALHDRRPFIRKLIASNARTLWIMKNVLPDRLVDTMTLRIMRKLLRED